MLDYFREHDSLKIGFGIQAHNSNTRVFMMIDGGLTEEDLAICDEHNFPILFKPFLACDV